MEVAGDEAGDGAAAAYVRRVVSCSAAGSDAALGQAGGGDGRAVGVVFAVAGAASACAAVVAGVRSVAEAGVVCAILSAQGDRKSAGERFV